MVEIIPPFDCQVEWLDHIDLILIVILLELMILPLEIIDILFAKVNCLEAVKIYKLGILSPIFVDTCVPVHSELLYLEELERPILFFAVVNVNENTLKPVVRVAVLQLVNHDREVEGLVNAGDLSVLKP